MNIWGFIYTWAHPYENAVGETDSSDIGIPFCDVPFENLSSLLFGPDNMTHLLQILLFFQWVSGCRLCPLLQTKPQAGHSYRKKRHGSGIWGWEWILKWKMLMGKLELEGPSGHFISSSVPFSKGGNWDPAVNGKGGTRTLFLCSFLNSVIPRHVGISKDRQSEHTDKSRYDPQAEAWVLTVEWFVVLGVTTLPWLATGIGPDWSALSDSSVPRS